MKKTLTLFLAGALTLSLAACGQGGAAVLTAPAQSADILTPLAATAAHPFTDIPADAAYADAVVWCYEEGLLKGTSTTTFAPEATLTRSMLVTALYRAAEEPEVSGAPAFQDTRADAWYSDAVVWAGESGLAQGYGNGLFGTDDPVSVEQLQVLLDRYLGKGDTWKGDPALAAPATRAQVAQALYEGLKEATPAAGGRVLVAYFSATGNTEAVAGYIAGHLNGDTYEIVPAQPYSDADLNYNNDSSRVCREHEDPDLRPDIGGELPDLEQYDTVFLGYPLWWGEAPHVVRTFLDSVDLTGKTVVPFCTSASSGLGESDVNLHDDAPDAHWLPGRRFSGRASRETVTEWLDTLELAAAAPDAGV